MDANVHLVIVDNGSDDGTLAVAERIRDTSMPGTVRIVEEAERGYVPPRHTGTIQAELLAREGSWPDVLVLQADADTVYTGEYVRQLQEAANATGPNAFLEGRAEFPVAFQTAHPDLVSLIIELDERVSAWLRVPASGDLVCTDSVCAYRLSDYRAWGGHLREYARGGEEIHAETTRLYMRSLTRGARKVAVPDALAYPSARKIESRPGEEIATAGFPRGTAWREAWRLRHPHDPGIGGGALAAPGRAELTEAVRLRELHLAALFGVLPLHVFRALGRDGAPGCDERLRSAAGRIPQRDAADLFRRPGVFVEDVLALVDDRDSPLWAM